MLHLFVLRCQNCNMYSIINITRISKDHKGNRWDIHQTFGLTTLVSICHVEGSLLRKSWEMVENSIWMFIRRLLIMIACWLIYQRFQNFFDRDWNLSLVNILWPKPQTAYVVMTKMLVVWASFGSRLLVRFRCQQFTLFSSTYATLQTDTDKQTSLKKLQLRIRFWSLRRDLFSDPFRNRNSCLGRNPYCRNHWLKRLNLF